MLNLLHIVPNVMTTQDWKPIAVQREYLELAVEKVRQVDAAARDQSPPDAISRVEPINDSESISSAGDTLMDIVEDMRAFTECLVDLQSALNFPAHDITNEPPGAPPNGKFQEVSVVQEGSRAFAMMIRERYPSADPLFVGRLGEANLRRQERILALQESMTGFDEQESQPQSHHSQHGASSHDLNNKPAAFGNHPTSNSSGSSSRSRLPESIFSEAPMATNLKVNGKGIGKQSSSPGSDTTIESSAADNTDDEDERHVPPIPEASKGGQPFQCKICGELQQGIQSRTEWK
jgi:hypothetical protein